jgi:hypothetical protein
MNKNLTGLGIVKENVVAIGPYTIVELENGHGNKGYGLSRKSIADRFNPDLGYNIALGRAKKSLYYKTHKVKNHERSPFVG